MTEERRERIEEGMLGSKAGDTRDYVAVEMLAAL